VQPADQIGRTRTVVIVVADERGTRHSGIARGVIDSSPRPLSGDAAAYPWRLLPDTHEGQR
jgi:hypothetical protein